MGKSLYSSIVIVVIEFSGYVLRFIRYRSPFYNGRWAYIEPRWVPHVLLHLPPVYRHGHAGHGYIPQGQLKKNWRGWEGSVTGTGTKPDTTKNNGVGMKEEKRDTQAWLKKKRGVRDLDEIERDCIPFFFMRRGKYGSESRCLITGYLPTGRKIQGLTHGFYLKKSGKKL